MSKEKKKRVFKSDNKPTTEGFIEDVIKLSVEPPPVYPAGPLSLRLSGLDCPSVNIPCWGVSNLCAGIGQSLANLAKRAKKNFKNFE